MLFSLAWLNNLLVFSLKAPLSVAVALLAQTLVLACLGVSNTGMSVMAYILLVVFISGVMVMFLYISSLTSNIFVSSPSLKLLLLFFFFFFFASEVTKVWLHSGVLFMWDSVDSVFKPLLSSDLYGGVSGKVTVLVMLVLLMTLSVVTTTIRGSFGSLSSYC